MESGKEPCVFMVDGHKYTSYDRYDDIQKCLTCPRPDCTNCLCSVHKQRLNPGTYHRFTTDEYNLIIQMIKSGKNYKEVCAVIYIGKTRFYKMKREVARA